MTNKIYTSDMYVSCDGEVRGILGHPKVYLKIEDSSITCPYCEKLFILSLDPKHQISE